MGRSRAVSALRLLVPVVALSGLLVACGSDDGDELCHQGDRAVAHGRLAEAADAYGKARRGEPGGCGDQGLRTVEDRRREAFVQVSSGAGAAARHDLARARTAYEKALSIDAGNAEAIAGLARVTGSGQDAPQPAPAASPSPVASPSSAASPSVTPTGVALPAGTTGEPATDDPGEPPLRWWLLFLALLVAGLAAACFAVVNRAGRRLGDLEAGVGELELRLADVERSSQSEVRRRAADVITLTNALADTKAELSSRTDQVQELLTGAQAELGLLRRLIERDVTPLETVVFLGPDPGAREAAGSSGGGEGGDADVTTVDVRIVVVPGDRPGTGRLVVQQMRDATPVELRAAVLDSLSRDGVAAAGRDPGAILEEASYDALSKELVDGTWPEVCRYWITPAAVDIADVADRLDGMNGLRDQWHELFLGRPVARIGDRIGLAEAPTDLLETTATEIRLPGDDLVRGIKHVLQFTGVVIGLATGNPLLANACVKSFAYDVARRAVARSAMEAVHAVFTPVREVTRTSDPTPRPATGTPGDLKANLERTARRERALQNRFGPGGWSPVPRPGVDAPKPVTPPNPGTRLGPDDGPGTHPGIGGLW